MTAKQTSIQRFVTVASSRWARRMLRHLRDEKPEASLALDIWENEGGSLEAPPRESSGSAEMTQHPKADKRKDMRNH